MTNCTNCLKLADEMHTNRIEMYESREKFTSQLAANTAVLDLLRAHLFGGPGQLGMCAVHQTQLDLHEQFKARMTGGMKVISALCAATLVITGLVFNALGTLRSSVVSNKTEISQTETRQQSAETRQQSDASDNREAIRQAKARQQADAKTNREAIRQTQARQKAEADAAREVIQRRQNIEKFNAIDARQKGK